VAPICHVAAIDWEIGAVNIGRIGSVVQSTVRPLRHGDQAPAAIPLLETASEWEADRAAPIWPRLSAAWLSHGGPIDAAAEPAADIQSKYSNLSARPRGDH